MSEIHIVNQHRLTEVQEGMTCTECRLTRDDDIAFGFFDCHKYDDAVIPRTTPFEPPQELSELNEHRGVWRGTSPSIQNVPRTVEASDNESRLRELNAKAEALQEKLRELGISNPVKLSSGDLTIIVYALTHLANWECAHRATNFSQDCFNIIGKIVQGIRDAEK